MAAIMVLTVLTGCVSPSERERDPGRARALVGAFPAADPNFSAIGAVAVVQDVDGSDEMPVIVCTGALIGPTTVVTAKHCLEAPLEFGEGFRLVFLLGVDGSAPNARIDVLATEGAPGDSGGYNGYGADVGVLHLREPVHDVVPLRLSGIHHGMVGADFLTVGYGAIDSSEDYGRRRVGTIKLKATSGPTYEALLGSFAAFYEFEAHHPLDPECDPSDGRTLGELLQGRSVRCNAVVALRGIFDTYQLEYAGEVAAGGYPGDAQPCSGDSGGPLLLRGADGRLTAHAVVSGGLASRAQTCAFGAIYASFSPTVLSFLQTALRWTDPCMNLPAGGRCDGNTARRCTTPLEGPRLALSFDCARAGTICALQADGLVGCGGSVARDIAAVPLARPTPTRALIHDPLLFDSRVFLAPGERLRRSSRVVAD